MDGWGGIMRTLLITLLSLTLWSSQASSGSCGGEVLSGWKTLDGEWLGLHVSVAEITATETWWPHLGEPPLPLTEAARLALEWVTKTYPHYDSFSIDEISLQMHVCVKGYWVYVISLRPMIDGKEERGLGSYAAVLFDGTVIAPKELEATVIE
jgi:hypothetical protein